MVLSQGAEIPRRGGPFGPRIIKVGIALVSVEPNQPPGRHYHPGGYEHRIRDEEHSHQAVTHVEDTPKSERVPPFQVNPQKATNPIAVSRGTRKRYMRPRGFSTRFGMKRRMSTTMRRMVNENTRSCSGISVPFKSPTRCAGIRGGASPVGEVGRRSDG